MNRKNTGKWLSTISLLQAMKTQVAGMKVGTGDELVPEGATYAAGGTYRLDLSAATGPFFWLPGDADIRLTSDSGAMLLATGSFTATAYADMVGSPGAAVGASVKQAAALFTEVRYFDTPNLRRAFEELRVFKARACFIVPGYNNYANQQRGEGFESVLKRQVHLLVADRDYGWRENAAVGSAADKPKTTGDQIVGVVEMDRRLEEMLHGDGLGIAGKDGLWCRCLFQSGEPVVMADDDRDILAGREGWHIDMEVEAGLRVVHNR